MMPRKLILPTLVLALAILACNIQVVTPSTPPPAQVATSTNTPPAPVVPSDTPVTPVITDTVTSGLPPASGGLTLDMLRNATYHAPYYDRTVTLVNGNY